MLVVGLVALVIGAVATTVAFKADLVYGYGDTAGHTYIARRVLDSKTPGFAQFGTNWLPALHLLMQPFVYLPEVARTGLAGAMANGPAFAVSAIALAYTAASLTRRRTAGFLAAAIFVTNPSILYLQSMALTEPLAIASLTVSAAFFVRWMRNRDVSSAIGFGLALAFGVFTRYDGWGTALVAGVLVVLYLLLEDPNAVERIEGIAIAVVAPAAFAMFCWFFYNGLIFGDPLAFARGAYSSAASVASQVFAEHNLPLSTASYLASAMIISGPVIVAASACVTVFLLMRNDRKAWIFAFVLLLTPLVFNVYSLYSGNSVIYTPHFGGTYFNVRYGSLLFPAIVLPLSLVTSIGRRSSRMIALVIVVAIVLLQNAIFVQHGIGNIATVSDTKYAGGYGVSISSVRGVANQWRSMYDGGNILVDMDDACCGGSLQSIHLMIQLAGIPQHDYITLDNGPVWRAALLDPVAHARWILVNPDSQKMGAVRAILQRSDVASSYRRVLSAHGLDVYRRVN